MTCHVGSSLISSTCYTVPANCVGLDAVGNCSSCFSGYLLSANTCTFDTTCNGTSSCTSCADGAYLSSGQCLSCTLPANCLGCSAAAPTSCFRCNDGYYLSSGACTLCTTGCVLCSSSSFCTLAGSGYYLIPNQDASNSGHVGTCRSPCSTCHEGNNICTSCVTGYSLNGTHCKSNSNVVLNVVFLGSGATPIVTTGAGATNNLASGMSNVNRIRFTMCQNLPTTEFGTITQQTCFDVILIVHLAGGSITVSSVVSGGNYTSAAAANSAIVTAFGANTALDGITVASVTASASGYTTTQSTSSGGANLGLILGLSIPLLLLLILIIIILADRKSVV